MGGPHRHADCSWRNGADGCHNEFFKPYDWGYFTLGASRGLAFRYYCRWPSLVALYALFLPAGASILGSIAAAVIGTLTPLRRLVDVVSALCDRGGSSG